MANHVWSVLCTRGILDKYTNKVSLVDVIEQVQAETSTEPPANAALPLPMVLVSLWSRTNSESPEKGEARVSLIGPAGTQGAEATLEIDLQTHRRARNFVNFDGVPWLGAGIYLFRVQQRTAAGKWRKVAELPLEVALTVAPSPRPEKGGLRAVK